jgi:hypothetical protein
LRQILERIDGVHDRNLPQDHLADDMARGDVRGINRRVAGGGRGQARGELCVIEFDAYEATNQRYRPSRSRTLLRPCTFL